MTKDFRKALAGEKGPVPGFWKLRVDSGKCLEVISCTGDVTALAGSAHVLPWWALTQGQETVIGEAATG